ncbi:DNA-processing protein DprA [Emcibacter sp.]|uniref:DNA-processing protein DprA n=1 Tax=Emcibacter sp. TaxID=1979954 RepID=UPI002AA81EED|nr:DNA-processing protein DprA [Emcibacter sp.]
MTSEAAPLSDQEKLNRLRLCRTERVGPVTFRELLVIYGTAGDALEALPELSRRGGRRKPLLPPSVASLQKELETLEALGGTLIVFGDRLYPQPLAVTDSAPPILMALGKTALFHTPCFGIVGARNASAAGMRLAQQFALELGQQDMTIVSGMARGIDTAVHQGSLTTGTIAVLAGGIDEPYPRENIPLYEEIIEKGLVVSEMPLGIQPQARHFPRRNRIISGLSCGVLVVEATLRSGSLITARQAAEQGREVFAVPGHPLDPRAKGPNSLIRDGAVLTETTEDILDVLMQQQRRIIPQAEIFPSIPATHQNLPSSSFETARLAIREKLSHTAVPIDDLIRLSDVEPAELQTVLLELELAGEIVRHPGNRVAFVK